MRGQLTKCRHQNKFMLLRHDSQEKRENEVTFRLALYSQVISVSNLIN